MSLTFHTNTELDTAASTLLPDMAQGFTIQTPSGRSFSLMPGRAAELLRDELGLQLQMEIARRGVRNRSGDVRFMTGAAR